MTATLTESAPTRQANQLPPVLTLEELRAALSRPAAMPTTRTVTNTATAPSDAPAPRGQRARRSVTPTALPEPRLWTQRFAIVLLECLEGRRPPAQIASHLDADVLARVTRRYRATLRRGSRPGPSFVRRVRICQPRPDVVEAAVVARISGRPTAIALRMKAVEGRWIVVVLEML